MGTKDYQKLKEVIWKANPSILELRFGCEVQFKEEKGVYIHGFNREHWVQFYNYKFPPQVINKLFEHHIENLGRPIRLADVLLAAQKIKHPLGKTFGLDDTRKQILWHWKCQDDNLDHQLGDTKQFLIDLLVKE